MLISSFSLHYSYSLRLEYPTQPGYGVNRGPKSGFISRTQEGKFVIDPDEDPFNTADEQQQRRGPRSRDDDEGGFEVELPPNRFRTRSVAIVAGYSPERLYSNMPAGAFVVESGMYKMNRRAEGGEQWERPEAVYWKQVSFNVHSYILLLLNLNFGGISFPVLLIVTHLNLIPGCFWLS